MGSVGDHWRDAKSDKEFYKRHGRWPGQRVCADCKKAFYPPEQAKHARRCQKCHKKHKQKDNSHGQENTTPSHP